MMKRKIAFFFLLFTLVALISYISISPRKPSRPYLTVIGPLNMADGLGRQSAELIDTLMDEVSVNFISTSKKLDLTDTPKRIRKILKNKSSEVGKIILYEECFGVSEQYVSQYLKRLKNEEEIRIAYSMFEASRIPPSWVELLNQYFDAVAIPDPFLIEVYQKSGVTIPIFVLPLGVNIDNFLQKPLKERAKKPFVFANLSTTIPRKNHLKLLMAFYQAFGNSSEVLLRLNSRYGDGIVRNEIKEFIEKHQLTNVEFTEKSLKNDRYTQVFQEVDCYVSLSMGEGFSIQPREAMAQGIPCIVTDNTGQSTICKSGLVRVVSSHQTIPAFFPALGTFGVFFDCELQDAVHALRDVYEHYDFFVQSAPAARKWVKQYSFSELKPLYLSLVKPKKIILGNENRITKDAFITSSNELYQKYQKLLREK